MLEGEPQSAIETLEKAKRLDNGNPSISIDLAGAYVLRGQTANRPEDFGQAIDLLKSVLATNPQNDVAEFNCAIALEKQLLKKDAIQAWEDFLKHHPDSAWAPEARSRLEALRQETRLRKQRSEKALMRVEQVALASLDVSRRDEIDTRIEEYQQTAIEQWLPQFFASKSPFSVRSRNLSEALSVLAALLQERHQDPWLHDMIGAGNGSSQIGEAVRWMAESERLMQSSDDDRALQAATRARALFEKYRVRAGTARTNFTIVLIDQLRHQIVHAKNQPVGLLPKRKRCNTDGFKFKGNLKRESAPVWMMR